VPRAVIMAPPPLFNRLFTVLSTVSVDYPRDGERRRAGLGAPGAGVYDLANGFRRRRAEE